jgi:hypothetical protein
MTREDRKPPPCIPSTAAIVARSNNRLGAVYSALHSFWMAHQAVANNNSNGSGTRRDAYSVLLYHGTAMLTSIINNFNYTPDQLLQELLQYRAERSTNFEAALALAQTTMEAHWSTERSAGESDNTIVSAHIQTRSPILIFLSDGESHRGSPETGMYDICRRAVTLG